MFSRYRQTSVPYAYVTQFADSSATVADNAITSTKIEDGTIQPEDLSYIPLTRPLSPGVSTDEIEDDAVTSGKILDETIQFDDIGQNEATNGQVMKWDGSVWIASDDVSGELELPYSGVVSSSNPAFTAVNTGTGKAGRFRISNTGSTEDALSGETNGSGRGIYGKGVAPDYSINYGFLGSDSIGVYGENGSSNNYGYIGSPTYGIYGEHENSGNYGYIGNYERAVYGRHGSSNTYGYLGGNGAGVYGASPDNNTSGFLGGAEYGVSGHGHSGSQIAIYGGHQVGNYGYLASSRYGVYGYANGVDRIGIYGSYYFDRNYAYLADENFGVYSYVSSDNDGTCAVWAENVGGDGWGVYTTTNATGKKAAVYAQANEGAYAVRASGPSIFDGKVRVQDTLNVVSPIKSSTGVVTIDNTIIVNGDLQVSGAMWTGFPKPTYNSGWFWVDTGEDAVLMHNLGGDPDDYFVDLQFKHENGTRHNHYIGEEQHTIGVLPFVYRGAHYHSLGANAISVHRANHDLEADSIRIRIWVIQ